MKSVQRYRALASICRQRAVFDLQHSWKHLGDAERWEHLAHAEIADRLDADGDGVVDLLLTSSWSNVNGFRSGRMFVISGK